MFCCRFRLLCVVGILSICFFADSSDSKKCVETERKALLKLKAGFIHGREFLSLWKGEDCCKWQGISCDNLTDHVTTLDLQTSYGLGPVPLRGKLDSSICELQHLTSLNLFGNQVDGKIPNCIGSLGQLIELQLGSNAFVGVIPPTLGNLSHLQTLKLGHNYDLNANDLEWVSHLSNLRYLDMSYVNLSQAVDWLSSLTKTPSLSELYLYGCGLPQVYPKSVPHLNSSTSLKELYLSSNNLNTLTLSLVPNVSNVITHLYLSGNELEGSLPESFQRLCQLKELRLSDNHLSGQLSETIQQLRCAQNGLEELRLDNNPFSSEALPDFSWLSSLRSLYLRNTNIIGSFPHSLGHMPHLEYLDLSHNRLNGVDSETKLPILSSLNLSFNELSGSLPFFEVTKLASLEVLDLSQNELNGSLPVDIGQLSNLVELYLFSNKLNGSIIEAHLSNLSRLEILALSHNSLSFNFNSNWVPPFQLYTLYASSCILGPKFPTWLKHQRELAQLDISNASISDSLPKWLWDQFSSLDYLNVSYNKLSGALPKPRVGRKSVYYSGAWDFSFNNLDGPLPIFPQIQALFLSNNWFSGSLSSFCASSSSLGLILLDLSNNLLEGVLPNCWGKFQDLEFLNLAKNKLSGRIPTSFGSLKQMVSLHLNNNKFSGKIPSLARCTHLTILDLGDNNLQGKIPAWVGHHLHHLIVLSLRANKFQGKLPKSLCNLSFLQVLDLSQNNITGEISQCLNHVIALSSFQFPRKRISRDPYVYFGDYIEAGSFDEKATLAWKGGDREYGKNLGLMAIIDLSCNHFTGGIPQSITKLVALAGLNLSRNNLTGFIPNNIGQMKMLESLDLSRNYLYGRMPESFSNLSFLSYMDLSFNNLSGKIPLSTQLQSFGASTYIGNNGLCGSPLTIHCPGDMDSSTKVPDKHVASEDTEEDGLITFGFYVSLGLGFFVGFCGVFGSLIIKASWRNAYFLFFNNMRDQIYVIIVVFTARMKRRFRVQI